MVAGQSAIVVALDWTDVDADEQAMIALSLVTAQGRALPLIWRTVRKATLKGHRNRYEDEVLLRLHEVLPPGVRVTVPADRGFGDQQLYAVLKDFGFDEELLNIAVERQTRLLPSLRGTVQGAAISRSLTMREQSAIDAARTRLTGTVSAEGFEAFDKYVREHVKRKIVIYGH